MHNKLSLIFALTIFSIVVFAQEKNIVKTDSLTDEKYIEGYVDYDFLHIFQPYNDMFQYYYDSYTPDSEVVNNYIEKIPKIDIKIILGTWCSDSQEQIAHLIRILEDAAYPINEITFIGVNHDKKAENIDIEQYNIKKVPTIIFYQNDKEIGRIVETPQKSLEIDMQKILEDIDI